LSADLAEKRERRVGAYKRIFSTEGKLNDDALMVLQDLMRFCHVNSSSVMMKPNGDGVDSHATMVAEGKREVWNRIAYNLSLDFQTIQDLRKKEL
jgi:hypothetical protein